MQKDIMKYDIIGDIHGCADSLVSLLNKLGYSRDSNGVYRRDGFTAAFLGDFIDRGNGQRAVIDIVRPMVEGGAAIAVMGNHEFNAIAFSILGNSGDYLRVHDEKNTKQHEKFLSDYSFGSIEYLDVISWFKSLPIWLELNGFRLVHACWDQVSINNLRRKVGGENRLTNELILSASTEGTQDFYDLEVLLKGKEIALPNGVAFLDKDKNPRRHIRIRWWDTTARTYRRAFLGPEDAVTHIPEDEIEGDHLLDYAADQPPVFIGHYWMSGDIKPLAENIACLDYSVAAPGGRLVAYRWNGENKLSKQNFIWVNRSET
jgi:hypothetical protein